MKKREKGFCLLPNPKKIELREGQLDGGAISRVDVPEKYAGCHPLIDAWCNLISARPERHVARDDRLIFGTPDTAQTPVCPAGRPEAYALKIDAGGIAVAANGERGVAHALRTLVQLADRSGGRLPCCEIEDYPDIAMRGYHLDCKAGLPALDELYRFADLLGAWKINTLLMEYEDRFPFQFAPEITLPGSPTLAEWAAFLAHCRGMGMTIIPLVQTHGHLNYVLKHEKFADLREGEEVSEICPSNPNAVAMVKTLVDEVMALHEPDEYFHIGADEAWKLASCPRCRERLAAGETKLDVFCTQVMEMHRHVRARGKTVLMWCDMFWRSNMPEMVNRLPKDIVLCEWIYTLPTALGSPRMAWDGRLLYTQKYCADHPELPVLAENYIENAEPKAVEFAQKYLCPDPATGIGKISAHAEYFMRQGYRVLGVGAARSGQGDWRFGQGNIIDRINNIANWADYAVNSDLTGVIISSWSRGSGSRPPYSPWLSALDAMAASAQFLWTPRTTWDEFTNVAGQNLFGMADGTDTLAGVYRHMGIHDEYTSNQIQRLESLISRGHRHLAMLKLWCDFDLFRADLSDHALGMEKMLSGVRYGRVSPHGDRVSVAAYLTRIDGLLARCAQWRDRLQRELVSYFRPEELMEYVDSRLDNLEFRLKNLRDYLRGIKP